MINGNAVGNKAPIKTLTIVDENGLEMTGVIVDSEIVFDATPADVKIGKTFVSDEGVLTGTDTKIYRINQGVALVLNGDQFTIPLSEYNQYDYDQLQCIIAPFNTSMQDSVASDKIVLNDMVYPVNSLSAMSKVTKDNINKLINLNIINNTEDMYVIHYFTYREEV